MVGERNLARNTQQSYRDTLRLLLPAVARGARKPIDRLAVDDVSADRVRQFLTDLEEKRGCAIATRNQRLAAIHALARFIGLHAPGVGPMVRGSPAVPFKKAPRALVTYLEKAEMDAVLAAAGPDDGSGPPGPRLAAVPVQHRGSGRRGGPGPDRRPDLASGARAATWPRS